MTRFWTIPVVAADAVVAVERWLAAPEPDPVLIETSGSTGKPKQVLLSRAAVVASAGATATRLGGEGQWVLSLPVTYVAGFQVICRSLLAGHRPIVADSGRFAEAVDSATGQVFTSVVSTQLRRALADPIDRAALASCHTVLVGGGPVDALLRTPDISTVATYGSAETAGGCVYDGLALDGVVVAIDDDDRILIRGDVLFDGYLDDPSSTASVLVDGWFHTSDAGRLDAEGRLQVLGRLDDMLISGGVKVPAAAVAARLREHPQVDAAEVIGVPDEEWGQRVSAVIVGSISLTEARDWVAAVHPRSWAPRSLVVVEAMPMLANGKVDRLSLAELVAR